MSRTLEPGAEKLIVALDVESAAAAVELAGKLGGLAGAFKIGKRLFTAEGPEVVRRVREAGGGVFLDLKFHDIPNTVADAAVEAVRLGVSMFNVHALGGARMIQAAASAVHRAAGELKVERPKLLAVTILTSLGPDDLEEIGFSRNVEAAVWRLAKLAKDSGADGVVASARETALIKDACGSDFLVVTPGIRPAWAAKGDQRRVLSPADAVRGGSDYLVIGRPIIADPDPVAAARRVLEELAD